MFWKKRIREILNIFLNVFRSGIWLICRQFRNRCKTRRCGRCRYSRGFLGFGSMPGVNGVTGFDCARLDVRRGELTEFFPGGDKICGAVLGSAGRKNRAGLDGPLLVALNQYEAFPLGNGRDAAHQLGRFRHGFIFGRILLFGRFRGAPGGEQRGDPEESEGFHGNILCELDGNGIPEFPWSTQNPDFVRLDEVFQSCGRPQHQRSICGDAFDNALPRAAGGGE